MFKVIKFDNNGGWGGGGGGQVRSLAHRAVGTYPGFNSMKRLGVRIGY